MVLAEYYFFSKMMEGFLFLGFACFSVIKEHMGSRSYTWEHCYIEDTRIMGVEVGTHECSQNNLKWGLEKQNGNTLFSSKKKYQECDHFSFCSTIRQKNNIASWPSSKPVPWHVPGNSEYSGSVDNHSSSADRLVGCPKPRGFDSYGNPGIQGLRILPFPSEHSSGLLRKCLASLEGNQTDFLLAWVLVEYCWKHCVPTECFDFDESAFSGGKTWCWGFSEQAPVVWVSRTI